MILYLIMAAVYFFSCYLLYNIGYNKGIIDGINKAQASFDRTKEKKRGLYDYSK